MNYYEELGVSQTSSVAEIHLAYKALVKILHPDQQQDEKLRRLSELQLRRLNHIMEVLTDTSERGEYDRTLDHNLLPVLVRHELRPEGRQEVALQDVKGVRLRLDLRFKLGMFVWPLIVGIFAISFVLWFREPAAVYSKPATVVDYVPPTPAAVARERPLYEIARPSAAKPPEPETDTRRQVDNYRQMPPAQAGRSRNAVEPAHLYSRANGRTDGTPYASVRSDTRNDLARGAAIAVVQQDPARARESLDAPSNAPRTEPLPLAGKWLYASRPDDAGAGLYPPQYIEMQITSRGGVVRGRYYGKYSVNDPAISPEVRFQFEGKPNEAVSVLPWSSAYGNKGEVRLKRLSEEALEVTWVTTVFGRSDYLASGKARMYRTDNP